VGLFGRAGTAAELLLLLLLTIRSFSFTLRPLSHAAFAVASFIEACSRSNMKAVKKLFKANPALLNRQSPDEGLQTCLMIATLSGSTSVVEWALLNGADVTIGEAQGYTPMHGAGE